VIRPCDDLQRAATLLLEAARLALQGRPDAVQRRAQDAIKLLVPYRVSLSIPADKCRLPFAELPDPPDVRTTRVLVHIESNLSNSLRVSEMARFFGMSGSHFNGWFRRQFGATPHTYISTRRMELAKSLLLGTSMPLSEVALQCGMSDQPHFTRAFRRLVGDTPARWRSMWAEGTDAVPATCALVPSECTVSRTQATSLHNRP
jgi:AraC family transcriptional regulator